MAVLGFLVLGFLVLAALAAADLAGALLVVPDLDVVVLRLLAAGAAALRSASSSIARCSVTDSGASPLRSEAFVSPSVT